MFLKKFLFWFVCLAKDPFYMQLTRDTYRRMFGSPEDKASYARVIIFFSFFFYIFYIDINIVLVYRDFLKN